MNTSIIKGAFFTIILLIVQIMVFNNIHLFGCATPLLLVYVFIIMPSSFPRWASLLTAFVLGIISDIFSNTPGVATSALVATAFIQPSILHLFTSREDDEEVLPSMKTFGLSKFLGYVSILVLLFTLLFYTLEEFSFFQLQQWFFYIIGSTILSIILILTIESLRKE